MKLYNCLKPESIKIDCSADTIDGVLEELVLHLKLKNKIANHKPILQKLIERERLRTTFIGHHSAVPHAKLKGLKEPIISIGTSKNGILNSEKNPRPVHLILLILSPDNPPSKHLQILAAAAALVKKSSTLINEILAVENPVELINIIKKYETPKD